jgi:hypothetical protein
MCTKKGQIAATAQLKTLSWLSLPVYLALGTVSRTVYFILCVSRAIGGRGILYNFVQFGSHASHPFFFIAAIIFSQFIRILLDFNCTKIPELVPN